MGSRYRRTVVSPSPGGATDSSDPYAAYLNWVADGRPSLGGGGAAAARPEPGTVLLGEHVQVQASRPIALGPVQPATVQTGAVQHGTVQPGPGGESLVPRESVWRRLIDVFRRP